MTQVAESEMTDEEWLRGMVCTLMDPDLLKVCRPVLSNPDFFKATASAVKHQPYTGGLAAHTREVLRLALAMADNDVLAGKVSRDVIITAVLWHDYGKIWDYAEINPIGSDEYTETGLRFGYARHRWTIRHLSRSYAEFMIAARAIELPEERAEEVGHCILAHHGRTEWGSPVEPMTPEAYLIHAADTMSARFTEPAHVFRTPRTDWSKGYPSPACPWKREK